MERAVLRRWTSVLCLAACAAVLWGTWRLTESTLDEPPGPELQFWPFRRMQPAPPRQPPVQPPAQSASPTQKPAGATPAGKTLPAERSPSIRVGLFGEGRRSVNLEVSGPFVIKTIGNEKVLLSKEGLGPTAVTATSAGLKLGKQTLAATQVEIFPTRSPAIWVEGHQYRGTVRFYRHEGSTVAAINVLPLEEYVASVVDGEMPAAFPEEARKAQAIVARTYALYQKQVAERGSIADLYASTRSQKYLGYQYRDGGKLLAGESESSRQIAAATRGQVCHYQGKIFCTYYCAVCGGSTVRGTEVFSDAAPPLVSVKCDFCREARLYRWTAEISKADLQKELDPWFREKGRKLETLKTVSLSRPTPGSSLPDFEIRADGQSIAISGAELRQVLSGRGLYSPRFTIADRGKTFEISGRGHGHGVGLCQWGARGQALEGRTCQQILSYYYPGSTVALREKVVSRK
jgi:stage II sporulation protein D (peptidoglycan lytic transglycosylase)